MTIIAVTGMIREARVIEGPGVTVIVSGGDGATLGEKLERIAAGARGIISIGIAGGLTSQFKPGDVVIASKVVGGSDVFQTQAEWNARMLKRLPHAHAVPLAGVDAMIVTAQQKARLFDETGAHAADMESHIVARIAARNNIPFAVLRTIADAAGADLPPLVARALKPDGRVDYRAVAGSLLVQPGQIPDLIRTARESKAAIESLLRCRRVLGAALACPDGG